MNNGWKKILILAVFNAVLILGAVLFVFWQNNDEKSTVLADVNQLFPVVLGPDRVITSPPPAFYSERQSYRQKVKGIGFDSQKAESQQTAGAVKIMANPVEGAAQTASNSYLSAVLPESVSSKLTASADIFVFPAFYVDYLNEMQDIMAADGALKEKRTFKTNDDVVLFLDDFSDYLIAEGVVPKSEESRLHSGIRKALELLKDEATQPQSYFNFPLVKKLAVNQKKPSDYGFKVFLNNFSFKIQPLKTAQAQTEVLGFKITPEMGQKAGKFIGGKLGDTIGDKLGKFIPSGVASQIGSFVGSKVGAELGNALGSFFRSGPSAIDSQLRLQIAAEFSNTGTLADAFTSQELQSLYGPSLGSEIDEMFRAEMGAEFGGIQESSFFGDLTKGLQDLLGSDFGKILGDLFGKFNDLSSVFSDFGSLGSLPGLGGGGGGGGGDCYRSGFNDSGKKFVQNNCQTDFGNNQNYKDRFLAITIGILQKILPAKPAYAQGGGSNLFAPCCNCRTPKGQPLGCLNKVCPSGPAIWDSDSKICGCGK